MPTEEELKEHPYPKTVACAKKFFDEAFTKFCDKLSDYGTSDLHDSNQVVQRMREKFARFENISKRPAKVVDEPITDIFIDNMGYSAIAGLMLQGSWGEEAHISAPSKDIYLDLINSLLVVGEGINKPAKIGDTGYDLITSEDTLIPHHSDRPIDIPTDTKVKIPDGYFGVIINRSSAARKLGIDVVLGVIDNGYTGELYACVWNRGNEDILIEKGQRIAQLVLLPMTVLPINKVNTLPTTERGESGFGSSDKNE